VLEQKLFVTFLRVDDYVGVQSSSKLERQIDFDLSRKLDNDLGNFQDTLTHGLRLARMDSN
jgi:hypothetical protein